MGWFWEKKRKKEAAINWEDYWNNKRPKVSQNYLRIETDGKYLVDVRDFFQYNDANLPFITGSSNDEKALNCLLWVINNVKYVGDKMDYGFEEYWAFAYQTLKRKKGDCEDGAILLANMMMKSGIPYWRIRLNAGSCNGGGHAYVTYCRETDNQFVVCDWCYWPNNLPMNRRKKHSEEQNYSDKKKNYGIWFSWNAFYCFGSMDMLAGLPKKHFK